MKKLFFSLLLVLISINIYAQTTMSHTIQRGETLESVAKKYGITVADLQQANPDTKEYFYAGMKLTIPQVGNQVNPTQHLSDNNSNSSTNDFIPTRTPQSTPEIYSQLPNSGFKYVLPGDEGSFEAKTFNVCFDWAFVVGAKPDGYIGSPWSMLISAGVNLRITAPFYAGIRLGYMYSDADYTHKATFTKSETTLNSLVLPIEIGYSISSQNKKFAFTPVAGILPSVSLSGKSKFDGEERKLDTGKFDMAYNVGLRIRLWEYFLSAQYIFKKVEAMPGTSSKIQGSPLFSLGWGF